MVITSYFPRWHWLDRAVAKSLDKNFGSFRAKTSPWTWQVDVPFTSVVSAKKLPKFNFAIALTG
jgi:hypothetical protein